MIRLYLNVENGIIYAFLKDCKSIVKPQIDELNLVKVSEDSLFRVDDIKGLPKNLQIKIFAKFISLSCHLGSCEFSMRVRAIVLLINTIIELSKAIQEEIKEYVYTINEFKIIMSEFSFAIKNFQHIVRTILDPIKEAKIQLKMLRDIFSLKNNKTLYSISNDKNNVNTAINELQRTIKQVIEITKNIRSESRQSSHRTEYLCEYLYKKDIIFDERKKIVENLFPELIGGIIESIHDSETFDYILKPIEGIAISPIAGLVAYSIIGRGSLYNIVSLFKNLCIIQKYKAIEYFTQALIKIKYLYEYKRIFFDAYDIIEKDLNYSYIEMKGIESHINDPHLIKINYSICSKAILNIDMMIDALQEIGNININLCN